MTETQGLKFRMQMIEEAFDVHEYDEETGERCCTADQPCTTRRGITKVYEDAKAKLAGGGVDVPTAQRSAGSGNGSAPKPSNQASEKQIEFIKSLAGRANLDKLGKIVRGTVEAAIEGRPVTKRSASTAIDNLSAIASRPASEKQIEFIKSLAASKGVEVDTENMGAKQASAKIDELKTLADAPKTKVANRPELEDGMYQTGDDIFKVQHAVNGSGRQYAKKLVNYGNNEFGFEFAPGMVGKLKAENRMTREQAEEFGKLYGTCCVCGRTLTDEKSIERGVGPVCNGKV